MKFTVGEIRAMAREGKITVSPAYLKKERVRGILEKFIAEDVRSGAIKNQTELDEFITAAQMSLEALKMVPYDVYVVTTKRKK